jgi:hypothetical protein
MDLGRTITEPFARLIAFHNAFNLNVKFTYGALARLDTTEVDADRFMLPNGGEPWGNKLSWSDMGAAVQDAAAFISELGVVRSVSSFEDYVTGATAELNRAGARNAARPTDMREPAPERPADADVPEDDVAYLRPLVRLLVLDPGSLAADLVLVEFFQVARNCIVHRSGRASPRLAEIRQSQDLADALKTWPRRKGKWMIAVPEIEEGDPVPWLPRHAIMASACHHRCAAAIDAAVVEALGVDGVVSMAAHWCLLADNSVPCPAKLDAQTMIRTQLVQRYFVRHADMADVVQSLRDTTLWERARIAFGQRNIRRVRDERRLARR